MTKVKRFITFPLDWSLHRRPPGVEQGGAEGLRGQTRVYGPHPGSGPQAVPLEFPVN
jgi:hypothetical protein